MILKPHLAELIAQRCGVSQATAAQALNDVLDAIGSEIAQGGEVKLIGFGSFSRKRQHGGKGRNLRTGETVEYPESQRPAFTPFKPLRERVRATP